MVSSSELRNHTHSFFVFKFLANWKRKELAQKIKEYLERRFKEVRERNGEKDNGDESLPKINWKKETDVKKLEDVVLLLEKVKENPYWGEGRGSRKCGVFSYSVSF